MQTERPNNDGNTVYPRNVYDWIVVAVLAGIALVLSIIWDLIALAIQSLRHSSRRVPMFTAFRYAALTAVLGGALTYGSTTDAMGPNAAVTTLLFVLTAVLVVAIFMYGIKATDR